MAVAKVIEVIAESSKSWEDAVQQGIVEASKSVRGIRNVYVEGMQAIVENGKIAKYRVNCKLTFVVD